MTLFLERGYPEVTVAEIADRAGLTKRTFFNHFPDKREVLFAGAPTLEASAVEHLAQAPADLDPLDAAVLALAHAGQDLAVHGDGVRLRRDLVASSPELRERELIKTAALATALAGGLERRDVPARVAALTAQAAVAVFMTAFDDWVEQGLGDLGPVMQRALGDLRQAVAGGRG